MRSLFAALAGLLLAGCNPTVSFDTTVKGTSTIPGSPNQLPITLPNNLGFNNVNFSQSSDFVNNNTDKSHIDHVRVKTATLTVTSPSGQDLSFLQSLSFTIASTGQPTKTIAHQTVFPSGQTSVQLVIDGVDLAPYAKADSFSIGSTGNGTAPPHDTTININMVLTIDAHVL